VVDRTSVTRTAAIILLGALGTTVEAGESHVVTIEGMQFSPAVLTVRRGEPIKWVNQDMFPHTVTADSAAFDSKDIAADGTWSFTPGKGGEFAYSCRLHPTMKARLIVLD
jgi:plastocyanin